MLYTSVQVNVATVSKWHTDGSNVGPSIAVGLGDFEGGELLTWTSEEGILEHDIKGVGRLFNGLEWHASRAATGWRCSLIGFTHPGISQVSPEVKQRLRELGFPDNTTEKPEEMVPPSLLPGRAPRDSLRARKAAEDDEFLGGMRNPTQAVTRVKGLASMGAKVSNMYLKFEQRHPEAKQVGELYGNKHYSGPSKELVRKFAAELRQVVQAKPELKPACEFGGPSRLDGELIQA